MTEKRRPKTRTGEDRRAAKPPSRLSSVQAGHPSKSTLQPNPNQPSRNPARVAAFEVTPRGGFSSDR